MKGFVYIIHAVGTSRIKIGYSLDPQKRLSQLQVGAPCELKLLAQWPGSPEAERQAHKRLAQYRCNGEWFAVPPFVGRIIHQAIVTAAESVKSKPVVEWPDLQPLSGNEEWAKPSIWGKLWRLERSGDYYRWRLAFTPARCSRTGGRLTPEILQRLQHRPGPGRHGESRAIADLLRKRAAYVATLCSQACGNQIG